MHDLEDDYSTWKGWAPESFGRFSASDARYFDWHVARALPGGRSGLSVLELGFGNGSFLGWARDRGHRPTGVETNARLVELAHGAGYAAHTSLNELARDARFDLIAGFDVLEHVALDALPGLLGRLEALMQPDSAMLFRFPNGESPWSGHMQYGDATHLSVLTTSRLQQLALPCGLAVTHSGEALPWRALPRRRRFGALLATAARRTFERRLRKLYGLGRGLDFGPNQLVVLSRR